MKQIAIFLFLLAPLCLPGSALAANFYWGAALSGTALETGELKLKLKNATGYSPQRLNLGGEKTSYAPGLSLLYGLDFAWAGSVPLRLELESALRDGGSAKRHIPALVTGGSMLQAANAEAKLDIRLNFWLGCNLWLDIPVGGFPLKPYIGGGLGANIISYDAKVRLNPGQNAIESIDSERHYDYALQYQLGLGARLPVARRAFLDIGLRYLERKDWSIEMTPFDLEFSARALSLNAAFNYYF